jgi:hypothetical protein
MYGEWYATNAKRRTEKNKRERRVGVKIGIL